MDLSTCSFVVPSFARESAASLPGMLQWEGIHCRVTAWLLQREARASDMLLWSVSLLAEGPAGWTRHQIGCCGQCPCWTEGPAGWTRHQIGCCGQCPCWTEGPAGWTRHQIGCCGQRPYWTEGPAGWTRHQIGCCGQCPYWTEGPAGWTRHP